MNILYILYDNFRSNSALHVHNFANALVNKGHECIISIPGNKATVTKYMEGDIFYTPLEFNEIPNSNFLFSDNKPPDIIHAWTPREIVRKQYIECKKQFPLSKLIIHLEDNETVLLKTITGLPLSLLRMTPRFLLRRIVSDLMSHPRHYKKFIKKADGITIIMDTLIDFVSNHQPSLVLWPIIHPESFPPAINRSALREKMGIAENETLLAYTGNVHPSNAEEVRTLYLAVGLANQNGIPAKLIRTGINVCDFLTEDDEWIKQYIVETGFVERDIFSSYLDMADILIQPGHVSKFNDYRLPSKIPEFLATGKPVAVPNTNIGRFLKDGEEAIILKKGDAQEIVETIRKLRGNKNLADRISNGGRKFVMDHFNKEKISKKLEAFYQQILDN